MKQHTNKWKVKSIILLFSMLLLLFSSYAGVVSTQQIVPSYVNICGDYANSTEIVAQGIYNNQNYTLNNVVASIVANQSGLINLSSTQIIIGDITPAGYSAVEPSWALGCNEGIAGDYLVYIEYSGDNINENSLGEATANIIVTGAPPAITEIKPRGIISNSEVNLEIITDENSHCRFTEWNTEYELMPNDLIGDELYHSLLLELADGDYTYYIRCSDRYDNFMQVSDILQFTVDTLPPVLSITSPSESVNTKEILLNVSTSENSVCKYDKSNVDYEDMTNELVGSFRSHKAMLSVSEGEHIFYVKCKDEAENIGESMVNIMVDLPPSAAIEIEADNDRIKEGIFIVKVRTSEAVRPTPRLWFEFDNSNIRKEISLEGSGKVWNGFMVVEQKADELVGSFDFSGTDFSGNTGREITSGKLFIVDTQPPPAPADFYIKRLSKNKVSLKWYYEGEEAELFHIYRSTEPYVNYANFLVSTSGSSYTDEVNDSVKRYYYKISVIDTAGNEGSLSNEANVTINGSLISDLIELANGTIIELDISRDSFDRINKILKEAEELKLEVNYILSNLRDKNALEADVVDRLGLLDEVLTSREKIDTIVDKIDMLRYSSMTQSEIDKRIAAFKQEMYIIESSTPTDIKIIEGTEFEQKLDASEIENLIMELPLASFRDSEKLAYLKAATELQNSVEVNKEIQIVRIDYLDGVTEYKSLIRNTLISEINSDNIIVVEHIPKSVAQSAKDIEFSDYNHLVVVDDPVIRYELGDVLNYGIEYSINKQLDVGDARQIKTAILYDYFNFDSAVSAEIVSGNEMITGYSILSPQSIGLTNTEAIMILLGVVFIFVLAIYYIVFVRRIFKKQINEFAVQEKKESLQKEIGEMQRLRGEDSSAEYLSGVVEKARKDEPTEDKEALVEVLKMIKACEEAVNAGNQKQAAELYSKMRELYSTVPKNYKRAVHKKCSELHQKIKVIELFAEA